MRVHLLTTAFAHQQLMRDAVRECFFPANRPVEREAGTIPTDEILFRVTKEYNIFCHFLGSPKAACCRQETAGVASFCAGPPKERIDAWRAFAEYFGQNTSSHRDCLGFAPDRCSADTHREASVAITQQTSK